MKNFLVGSTVLCGIGCVASSIALMHPGPFCAGCVAWVFALIFNEMLDA